ncbi:MAG: hypothetical protein KJO38_06820 [Gammaproteobacteria bacterium]|nr:hypothetical protein [Gammaproteobacteria bacterium]
MLENGLEFRNAAASCTVSVTDELSCADGRINADPGAGDVTMRFAARVDAPATNGHIVLQREGLPLALLQPLVDGTADDYRIGGGAADVSVRLSGGRGGALRVEAQAVLEEATVEGINVVEGLDARVGVSMQPRADGMEWQLDAAFAGGAAYIEPGVAIGDVEPGFFFDFDAGPVTVSGTALRDVQGGWLLNRVDWHHAGVLAVAFDRPRPAQAAGPVPFELRVDSPDMARTYATYLQPALLGSTLDRLELAGRGSALVIHDGSSPVEVDVTLGDVYLDDADGRFSIAALDGGVAVHAGARELRSSLGWRSITLYDVPLGAGLLRLVSAGGDLDIEEWQDLPILDGALRISDLAIEDFGTPTQRIVVAGELTPISLTGFTAAVGWPAMDGQMSGTIPALVYDHGNLFLDGELEIRAFDGLVLMRDFHIEDLFGRVPLLSADVDIQRLDLEQLTSVFAFGRITGQLSGGIAGLRMAAWQPVSFDAWVATPDDDPIRHRISRKAVDNLSRIGSGAAGALSSGWLRFMPEYSYGEIGLRCRLENGFCQLSGVDGGSAGDDGAGDDSFFILTPGGILPPWIGVKGTGRLIGWNALLDGIDQISSGQVKVEY